MKVGFVISDYPVLSETFVLRQLTGLISKGHDVTIITGNFWNEVYDPLEGKVTIRKIRVGLQDRGITKAAIGSAKALRSLRCAVVLLTAVVQRAPATVADIIFGNGENLGEFDAIVAHFGPSGVRAMNLRAAGVLSGPIATVFHGIDLSKRTLVKRFRRHYRTLFERTEFLLPVSRLWRDLLLAWGASPDKVKIMRMGIDVDKFDSGSRPHGMDEPIRILTTARFVEKKGLRYAIEGVSAAGAEIIYDIIGSGPLESELRSQALGGPKEINFLGKRDHLEVLAHLKHADVFLLPSVTAKNGDMEGIPVSLMEAMSAGAVVIATTHSGNPELIRDGVEGILVPERDASSISRAIDAISSGLYDVKAMRLAAANKVKTEFNNELLDDELEILLAEMAVSYRHKRSSKS